jgi:hypothetical protein
MIAWVDALGGRFLAHQAKKGRTGETGTLAPDYSDFARSEHEAMEWLLANADFSDRIVWELAENAKRRQFPWSEKNRKTK